MENDEFAIDNGNQVMTLNQTDFASLARAIFKTVKHFNPSTITVKDSVIYALVPHAHCLVHIDMTKRLKAMVNMCFRVDKMTCSQLALLRGVGEIKIEKDLVARKYEVKTPNVTYPLAAEAFPEELPMPTIQGFVGEPITGYIPKSLRAYIARANSFKLLIYDDQLEVINVHGQPLYFFTEGMSAQLVGKQPGMVLQGEHAFSFDKEQTIKIGKIAGGHILVVENNLDLDVNLVVYERLSNR